MGIARVVTQDTNSPRFQRPTPIRGRVLAPEELRAELATLRQHLCEDLTYIAGLILNTGILTRVPTTIQHMTGMPVDELEAMETQACLEPPEETGAQRLATVEELLDEVRTIDWLVTLHLAAMREVTEEAPRVRPIEAEGALRAFLELHDVIVREMRRGLSGLRETPTAETARGYADFWQHVVLLHAQAEDSVLWPLARSLRVEGLVRSVDLLEAEHHEIDRMVESYLESVLGLERGQAPATEVVRAAQALRGRVELHFGKEEESVLRPMRPLVTDEQLWPVVAEQDRSIGDWLRAHGWRTEMRAAT
jgi:hemerythrin-like domain-containing protein